MENVLAVATYIPIIQDIGKAGIHVTPHWWGILFGGTLFGNLTMIESTANIVAIGIIERQKIGHITFGRWIKPGAILFIPTLAPATFLIYLQFYI
jgi:Na+/H+ antiporter NhaD/arsenite permease-like protein